MHEALQHPHLDEASFDEVINGDRRPWRPQDYKRSHEPSLIPSSGFSDDDLLVAPETRNGEAYDPKEVEAAVSSAVHYDVEHMDATSLMQPEVATEQALKAYDLYASDTNYPPEVVVAHYVHELSIVLIEEDPEVSRSEINQFIEDIETFLRQFDFKSSVDKLEPVTAEA